jgi:hypothetical protein
MACCNTISEARIEHFWVSSPLSNSWSALSFIPSPATISTPIMARSRPRPYRLVQRNAMKAWGGEGEFLELLKADPDERKHLSEKELTDTWRRSIQFSPACSAWPDDPKLLGRVRFSQVIYGRSFPCVSCRTEFARHVRPSAGKGRLRKELGPNLGNNPAHDSRKGSRLGERGVSRCLRRRAPATVPSA